MKFILTSISEPTSQVEFVQELEGIRIDISGYCICRIGNDGNLHLFSDVLAEGINVDKKGYVVVVRDL